MAERIVSSEILQHRSDAIILGMKRAVSHGMNPQFFRYLEEEPYPRKHRDLIQVYLGIKPCASYLFDVLEFYDIDALSPRDDAKYLGYFPKAEDTEVPVLTDGLSRSVWNPDLVAEVLANHEDLKTPESISPSDQQRFGDLLESFYNPARAEDILIHGIILGYPRIAVEMFINYHGQTVDEAQKIWKQAETQGIFPQTCPPQPTLFDLHDSLGITDPEIKSEFVRLADLIGYPNAALIGYVEGLRVADIPGWQYFTSSGFTLEEEKRAREQYASSQFDVKFASLLKELGV